jgi:hypothetical protein
VKGCNAVKAEYDNMTWYSYLKKAQNTVTLYHGTHTGKNDTYLASFKSAIEPAKSKDYGQGVGFYGYPSFTPASIVAKQRAQENNSTPMIVQIDVPIETIELDYEHQYPQLLKILVDNWHVFQQIPIIDTPKGAIDTQNSRINDAVKTVTFRFKNGNRRSLGFGDAYEGGGIEDGKLVYAIIKAITTIAPDLRQQLNDLVRTSLQKDAEIKYVGGTIKPTAIFVAKENNWSKISL